jgi:hypothetical protein
VLHSTAQTAPREGERQGKACRVRGTQLRPSRSIHASYDTCDVKSNYIYTDYTVHSVYIQACDPQCPTKRPSNSELRSADERDTL